MKRKLFVISISLLTFVLVLVLSGCTNISEEEVSKILNKLEDKGYIEKELEYIGVGDGFDEGLTTEPVLIPSTGDDEWVWFKNNSIETPNYVCVHIYEYDKNEYAEKKKKEYKKGYNYYIKILKHIELEDISDLYTMETSDDLRKNGYNGYKVIKIYTNKLDENGNRIWKAFAVKSTKATDKDIELKYNDRLLFPKLVEESIN